MLMCPFTASSKTSAKTSRRGWLAERDIQIFLLPSRGRRSATRQYCSKVSIKTGVFPRCSLFGSVLICLFHHRGTESRRNRTCKNQKGMAFVLHLDFSVSLCL